MNEIKVFANAEFGEVRTAEIDGKPYFVGADVAKALGYRDTVNALKQHCRGVVKHHLIDSLGRNQEASFITEGDLYRLIMKSKLPSAEKFESWVMDEVLPSIRENGGYIEGQENLSDEELLAKALMVAQKKIDERDKIISEKQEHIDRMRPKEIFADAVSASQTSILIGALAKIISQNGVQIGQNRLFTWMRDNDYLISRKGTDYNMPKQRAMDLGLFEIKERTINNPDGSVRITRTVMVTGKGQQYFINKFLSDVA